MLLSLELPTDRRQPDRNDYEGEIPIEVDVVFVSLILPNPDAGFGVRVSWTFRNFHQHAVTICNPTT